MEKVEGKVKRLQKQLTKWRQKKNYYEKTLKASGKI
jgi:predicted  nucleic acid-binding Zn-ribbon protein